MQNSDAISWSLNCKHWFENLLWIFISIISVQSAWWGMVSYSLVFIPIQCHGKCTPVQFPLASFTELLKNLHLWQYSKQTSKFWSWKSYFELFASSYVLCNWELISALFLTQSTHLHVTHPKRNPSQTENSHILFLIACILILQEYCTIYT